MKLKRKIMCLLVGAVISLACGLATLIPQVSTKAAVAAPDLSSLTEKFVTIDGASIRTTAPYGMRFTTSIDAELYNSIIEYYGEDNVVLGTKIARATTDEIKAQAYTLLKTQGTSVERTSWSSKKNPELGTPDYEYVIAVDGLAGAQAKANLNKSYVALGYMTITDTTSATPVTNTYYAGYTATGYRSPLQVALMHIASEKAEGTFDADGDSEKFVLGIVDAVMADENSMQFETEAGAQSLAVACGQKISPVVKVGGNSITVNYSVEDSTIAKVEGNEILGLKSGETTLTATVNGIENDYSIEIDLVVSAGEVNPTVNPNGTLNLATEGEATTVKVNGVALAGTYNTDTLNIVDYVLDNNSVTTNTKFTITVESASYSGTVDHTVCPVNNGNFVSVISNGSEANAENKTYFLTENITLKSWIGEDKGAFSTSWNGNIVTVNQFYAINGRGNTISASINSNSGNPRLFGQLFSIIYNTKFDFTIKNTSTEIEQVSKGLISFNMAGGLENCYINVDANIEKDLWIFGEGTLASVKDVIVNVNVSGNGKVAISNTASGKIDNLVIIDNTNSVNKVATYTNNAPNLKFTAYEYANTVDFVDGASATKITTTNVTEAHNGKVYESWSNKWSFASDITLCGKTVYSASKATVTPAMEDGKLKLNTNGQLTTVWVDGDIVATNVIDTFDIIGYAESQGWISTTEKTIAITVESQGYTGQLQYTFKQEETTITADYAGRMSFDVGSTMPTIKVNDVELTEDEYEQFATVSSFDLHAYALDYKKITTATEYVVSVENISYVGSLTYNYNPLNDGNFVSGLRAYNATYRTNRTFFLTDDITLERSDYDQWVAGGGCNTVVSVMNVHLDGRGHKISTTMNIESSDSTFKKSSMFGSLCSMLFNINFDFDITNAKTDTAANALLVGFQINEVGAGIVDCSVDVVANTNGTIILVSRGAGTNSIIKNVVVNYTQAGTGDVYFAYESRNVKNCVLIDSGAKLTKYEYGNAAAYAPLVYKYTSIADFVTGANGTKYNAGTTTSISTTIYGEWSDSWEFDTVNNIVKLLGVQIGTIA